MKYSVLFLVVIGSVIMSACATIISGTEQTVSVDSNVKGAKVYFSGSFVGTTPYIGRLKKVKDPSLMVSKEGYETKQQAVSTSIPVSFWGNILIGGFLGSTTDYASGAFFEISPSNFYVNLEPDAPAMPTEEEPSPKKKKKKAPAEEAKYNFQEDTELKRFTMINYRALSNDLAKGEGEYLNTLLTKLLNIRPDQRSLALAKLKTLAQSSDSAVHFGESVAAYYFSEIKI